MQDNALRDLQNIFAVHQIQLGRIEASLVTSTHERFDETIVEWVGSLLSLLHNRLGTMREVGDFLREQLIPKFPAKPLGKPLSDFTAAASIFPFHCDDLEHAVSSAPAAIRARLP
jgi:hypothetical protein